MPSPQQESTSRAARLDRVLRDLLHETPGIDAAAVVSFDGLPMASALPADMDEDRVAAMSAALLSLAERAAQGLGRGELSQVYLEGEQGAVFLVSAQDEAVLVAVSAPGTKVGMMLFEVRLAAARVGAVLRAPVPAPEPSVSEQSVTEQAGGAPSAVEPFAAEALAVDTSAVERLADFPVETYRYVQDQRVEVVPTDPASGAVADADEEPASDKPAVPAQPGPYPASSFFVTESGDQRWG